MSVQTLQHSKREEFSQNKTRLLSLVLSFCLLPSLSNAMFRLQTQVALTLIVSAQMHTVCSFIYLLQWLCEQYQ